MSERLTNEAVVERAIGSLRRQGALAEVFFRESASTSVEVKDAAIENVLVHGERGIGVRVIESQRMGFAFTSYLSAGGIEECVAAAQAMSAVTEADPDLRIASGATDRAELAIHEHIGARTVEERAEAAFAAERAARSTASATAPRSASGWSSSPGW